MGFDISLGLGLGLHEQSHKKKDDDPFNKANPIISLTLGVGGSPSHASSTCSLQLSSFSNSSTNISIKRERDSEELTHVPAAYVENNNINPSKVLVDDVDENGNTNRKKLRLTKQQSQLLEETFKDHSTLNPKEKQELARKLNLRTRQVEVWFQNRRARTKLKKTEMDCEELKKCYETLTEENKRLENELKDLKSMKTTDAPFNHMQLPVAGLTICPSCNRICTGSGGDENSNIGPSPTTTLLLSPKAHIHFYTSNSNNYSFTQSFATIAS